MYNGFLNPYGKGVISEKLNEFFSYLREHKPTGEFSQALDDSVINARQNTLWRKEYMTLQQEVMIAYDEGHDEGRAEGLAEARTDGLKALIDSLSSFTSSFEELYSVVIKNKLYSDVTEAEAKEIYNSLNN